MTDAGFERRSRASDRIFASLIATPPMAVRLLAGALHLSSGSIVWIAQALDSYADDLEYEDVTGGLARVRMNVALRKIAADPGLDALLERLEDAQAAPWPAIREALLVEREHPYAVECRAHRSRNKRMETL